MHNFETIGGKNQQLGTDCWFTHIMSTKEGMIILHGIVREYFTQELTS